MRIHLITAITLGAAVFLILVPYVGDNDFWFHLRTGQLMVEDGVFPRTDPFSFTAPGTPWVNHEYGAQLAFYGAYLLGGFPAVSLLVALMGTMFFGLLVGRSGIRSWPVVVLALGAAYALQPFFVPRPQIFAYVLLAAFIVALRRYLRTGDHRYLFVLAAVTLLWGNVHASVVLILPVFVCVIGAHLFRPFVPSFRRFMVAVGASIVASLANPFGWAVYAYALQPLRHREAYHTLIETQPLFEKLSSAPILVAFLLHLVLGAFVVWTFARRDTRGQLLFFEYLLFAGVFVAPLVSAKYLPFAWAVMVPISVSVISKQKSENSRKQFLRAFAVAGVGLAIAIGIFFQKGNITKDAHAQWPKGMAAFISENVQGNMYNPYSWGGYFMWQNQDRPVFIDGRFEMYADRVYWDALAFEKGERLDEIAERYGLSAAIARPWTTLAYVLSLRDDWALAYWDNFGMVYVQRGGENEDVIRKYAMRIPYINDAMDAVLRKVPSRELPALAANYREAVRRQPDLLLGRFRLGMLYQAAGRCDLAVAEWEAVIAVDQRLGGAHAKLAECSLALGDRERALAEAALSKRFAKRQAWWYGRY